MLSPAIKADARSRAVNCTRRVRCSDRPRSGPRPGGWRRACAGDHLVAACLVLDAAEAMPAGNSELDERKVLACSPASALCGPSCSLAEQARILGPIGWASAPLVPVPDGAVH